MAVVSMPRALGPGDLLAGVPVLRAVCPARPADRIVLAARARLAPVAGPTGGVDAAPPQSELDRPLSTDRSALLWITVADVAEAARRTVRAPAAP